MGDSQPDDLQECAGELLKKALSIERSVDSLFDKTASRLTRIAALADEDARQLRGTERLAEQVLHHADSNLRLITQTIEAERALIAAVQTLVAAAQTRR